MAAVPVVSFPIVPLIRLLGTAAAALVITWAVHFRGGLALVSDNKDLIFNVHPVLMVIGFVLLNGEGMLAYKTMSGTRSFRKGVHLSIQLFAFCLGLIGLWAAVKFHNDKGIDNFYSLHSWLGIACILLFGIQWGAGFFTFWYPGGSKTSRGSLRILASVACISWVIYLRSCSCYSSYWDLRKGNFPSNQQCNIPLLN